tara:strand:+ start:201 stop:668 length:468 start_codon:yes stop_codon:yes gene_type:complete
MFNKLLTNDELIDQEPLCNEETKTLVNGVVKLYRDDYHITCSYKDGKKDGLIEYVYKNGQLGMRGYYLDGKEHGLWEGFHANGEPAMRLNFKEQKLHGEVVYYSDKMDGQLHIRGHCYNNKDHGLWEHFCLETGKLDFIQYYLYGVEIESNTIPF